MSIIFWFQPLKCEYLLLCSFMIIGVFWVLDCWSDKKQSEDVTLGYGKFWWAFFKISPVVYWWNQPRPTLDSWHNTDYLVLWLAIWEFTGLCIPSGWRANQDSSCSKGGDRADHVVSGQPTLPPEPQPPPFLIIRLNNESVIKNVK